jgi:hypothetical protein
MTQFVSQLRVGLAGLVVLLSGGTAACALAPGRASMPVPLADVIALAKPYPNLVLQIRLELVRANTTRDKVVCSADRLDGTWIKIKNARVGPYRCQIGKRNLALTTTPLFYDTRGYKLSPTSADVALKAVRVQETKLKWTWN